MASSASDPLSQIPQELKDLFSWNPPRLHPNPHPGQKMSTRTRQPAFFDKHFQERLKLLHVVRLPSLVHDIAAVVDKSIVEFVNAGVQFPPSEYFDSATDIERAVRKVGVDMIDEKAVASFYDKTTATFCGSVASTLALRNPDLFKWTQSANVSGYAIADGFLTFAGPTTLAGMDARLKEAMDEKTRQLVLLLAQRFSSLATFEFKNLAANGTEVMLAIPGLSTWPIFVWTSCNTPDSECASMREVSKVGNVNVGPDAKDTPWTFDSHLSEDRRSVALVPALAHLPDSVPPLALSTGGLSVQGSSGVVASTKALKRKRDDGSSNQSRATSSLAPKVPEILPPTILQDPGPRRGGRLTSTTTSLPLLPATRKRSKKQDDLINVMQSTSTDLMPPPVGGVQVETAVPGKMGKARGKKGKAKAQGGNDEDSDNQTIDNDDPSYKDKYGLSAQCIVQQAWAQATRVDGSIIVLQSGNYEFIGIRNRSKQTLYISDLIEPHACKEPSYGKLHVGIYIAAIRDAMDRESQRDARPPGGGNGPSGSGGDEGDDPSSGGPDSGHRGERGGGRQGGQKDEGGGSKKPEGGMKPKDEGNQRSRADRSVAERMAIAASKMAAMEIASSRNVILLYLQYGIYDSSAPSTFVRSGLIGQAPIPLPSHEAVRNYRLEECLTIVLKSEIGHGATGEVLRGTLEVEVSACVPLDVAVKLALGREQCDALRNEYHIYHRLKSSGVTVGITTPLGLFDDVEGGACVLVMPYVGIPLDAIPEVVLPTSYREAILATLAEIHHADILHGDLRLDNILVADLGLTIIDFGHSRVCDDQDAKKREYSRLRALLNQRRWKKAKC